MTWTKICGTTNVDDAQLAVEAGADAVGFVFYQNSPRCVSVETVGEITRKLPERIEKIGVFVRGGSVDPREALRKAGLTGIQFYAVPEERDPIRQAGDALGLDVFPQRARMMTALPMNAIAANEEQIQSLASRFSHWGESFASGRREMLNTVVLDSGDLRQPGGTGRQFDWVRAAPIAEAMKRGSVKLVVAGGLTAENVGQAIQTLQPWGVDVSTGVEARPGKKDPEKVEAFVKAVREIDRKLG